MLIYGKLRLPLTYLLFNSIDREEKMYFQKAIEDRNKRYELNEKKKKKRQERGTVKVQ